MVAKKDFNAPKHMLLEDVSNLEVIKALTSLKSRGFVKEQFNWQYYFWCVFPRSPSAFLTFDAGSSRMRVSPTSAISSTSPLRLSRPR